MLSHWRIYVPDLCNRNHSNYLWVAHRFLARKYYFSILREEFSTWIIEGTSKKKQFVDLTGNWGGGMGCTHLSNGWGAPGNENLTMSQTAWCTKICVSSHNLCQNFHIYFLCILYNTGSGTDGLSILLCSLIQAIKIKIMYIVCHEHLLPSLVSRSRPCHKHCGVGCKKDNYTVIIL